MNKTQQSFLKISIWTVCIIFALRCIVAKINLVLTFESAYLIWGYIGEAILLTGFVMYAYNQFLWKFKLINKINHHPILAKKYCGELIFTWNDDMGNRPVKMIIEQTYLNIKVDFITDESSSKSINAAIDYIDGGPYLIYLYRNEPNPNLREISSMHYGHAKFDLSKGTENLSGGYFTDRKTVGSINVKAVKS